MGEMLSGRMIEISLEVDGEAAEAVCELFERHGGGAVVEVQVRDDLNTGHALESPRHFVRTYLPEGDVEARQRVEEGLWYLSRIHPLPEAAVRALAEANWAEAWKAHYKPLRIGKRFLVLPSWVEVDSADPQPGDRILRLDPGMAFGTGLHPTTQLCLEGLEDVVDADTSVLDVGTGSGILAIGAALLGATDVLGIDIDPKAASIAAENAELNGVSIRTKAGVLAARPSIEGSMKPSNPAVDSGSDPDPDPDPNTDSDTGINAESDHADLPSFDLVLANILANILIELAPALAVHTRPGGRLLASGVLDEQVDSVEAAFRAVGLEPQGRQQIGDWMLIDCMRVLLDGGAPAASTAT